MSKSLFLSAVSLVICLAGGAVAQAGVPLNVQSLTPNQIANLQEFKLQPRFNLWGYSGSSTLVEGQFLAPVYATDRSGVLYVMVEGNYTKNDDTWLGGAGLGYRQVVGDRIYGGYVTGDVVGTELRNKFVIANPGLELLGPVWDLNLNGYIPVTNKRKVGKEGWAGDDFGVHKYARAAGHGYYDHKLRQYEEPGRGADFEVARVIPHAEDAKLHLGAYHFDTPSMGSVNGVESRLSYVLNKYTSLEVENDYDNVSHNRVLFGIRFTLGGYSKEEKQQFGVATRLLDPVNHENVFLQGSNLIPILKSTSASQATDLGEREEYDNVWYFKAGPDSSDASLQPDNPIGDARSGNGTAEDPFVGFTPANYAAINPNIGVVNKYPLMFFAPGTYSLSNFSSRDISDRFALPNGWGMYGRNADYAKPADGSYPADFAGGIDLNYASGSGTAVTTLDSINVANTAGGTFELDGHDNAALYAQYADSVALRNASITNFATSSSFSLYVYGIYASHSVIDFRGGSSTIFAASAHRGSGANSAGYGYGIYANNSSVVNFNDGKNSVSGEGMGLGANSSGQGYGVLAYFSTINFNGGENSVSGKGMGGTDTGQGYGYGIYTDHSSSVNFNGGENSVSGEGDVAAEQTSGDRYGNGYGIYAGASCGSISFNDGRNDVVGVGTNVYTEYGEGYGLYSVDRLQVDLNGGKGGIIGTTRGHSVGVSINRNGGDYIFN